MAIYNILTSQDPLLRKKSKKITEVDHKIKKIINDLFDTLYATPSGVGLAAPQIGILKQVIVIDTGEEEPFALINPEIISGTGQVDSEEGCLSCPDQNGIVSRYETVKVEALNEEGQPVLIEADGFLAIVLQHEIDHLQGVLFIDKYIPTAREEKVAE